jgi:hypothetical protein
MRRTRITVKALEDNINPNLEGTSAVLFRNQQNRKEEKLKRSTPSIKLCKNFQCRGSSDREKMYSTTDSAGRLRKTGIS